MTQVTKVLLTEASCSIATDKIHADNMLRAATEAHVFIVITTALVFKQDLTWESWNESVYDVVLFTSFLLMVPMAFVAAVATKLLHVHRLLNLKKGQDIWQDRRLLAFHLQKLGLASVDDRTELRRYIDGWSVKGKYALFLSHFKAEAAAEARVLKLELVRSLRTQEDQIFLDADVSAFIPTSQLQHNVGIALSVHPTRLQLLWV